MIETIKITINDGTVISADIENFNATALAAKLNDQRFLMVSFGEVIANKSFVREISPDNNDDETSVKLQIIFLDGNSTFVYVESYNSEELSQTLNDPKILFVAIGKRIFNKTIIKLIAQAV